MSRESRRAKNRRKKIIMRRRILLVLFLLILIPILYKGATLLINGGKSLYSNITNKEEQPRSLKEKPSKINNNNKKEEPIKNEIANVKLLSVGDIMFHMPQVKAAYLGDGNYDFRDTFKHVKNHISSADISIANFETVTAGNDKKFSGFPQFNSPKETLFALKETGFDILSTANNHSLDQGKDGILKTLKFIEEYGLKSVGTYKDQNKEFLIEEKDGVKLGFLSYTYGINGLEFYLSEEELSYMISLIDEEKIKSDIEKIKKEVDVVVVSVHWGVEYQTKPNDIQIELGHKMVDWGANIVLGSHPHVLQKSEIIKKDGKDNFIIYSMGNFFSNQRKDTMGNAFTEDGVMVEIDIEKNITKDETKIKNIVFLPT
ncbi:CapA family protein [Tissierella creatinophila]|uniref:Capsule biosynthesis protein CapA n=1 Tax=Tissierella creatinophila DSM 6911 TaxID=1123403 RepID=A0A1U7M441_TISCR|nr:CapA family protein [Tissierella creatinophila]OLS02083.1 capsule biosynthesis protein CapA [Tissierella creatinophila DSM 6911]